MHAIYGIVKKVSTIFFKIYFIAGSIYCLEINQVGYITIKEDGTEFKQTDEDTPDYFKMSVPAHNNRPEAVVFFDKTFVSYTTILSFYNFSLVRDFK